jgi:phosphatidylinositol N-acetylglucosaminyltransferase subunit A
LWFVDCKYKVKRIENSHDRVGGVPEILPNEMMNLVEPKVSDLIQNLSLIILKFNEIKLNRFEMHEKVKRMYSWNNICDRTERVYEKLEKLPKKSVNQRVVEFLENFNFIFGILLCLFYLIMVFVLKIVEFREPEEEIDIAVDNKK